MNRMYDATASANATKATNGTFRHMRSRNGGPTFRTTAARMYWKALKVNRAELSEFWRFLSDFSASKCGLGGLYHGCSPTAMYAMVWTAMTMRIWPMRGTRTLRETRDAVGRFRESLGYGPDQPTEYVSFSHFVRIRKLTEDGDGDDQEKVDEEELTVAQIGGVCVEEADGGELDGGVQTHVLEAAEAGHQRCSSLAAVC